MAVNPAELLALIKSRRSIRKFTSQPVADDIIQEAITAGVWAPSACNQVPVRFVALKNKADLRILNQVKPNIANPQAAIMAVLELSGEFYQQWYHHHHTKQNPLMDVGAAVQNMALVFQSHGLATCWGSLSPYLDYSGYKSFFRRFRLSSTSRISSVLFIGYPAKTIDVNQYTHHHRVINRGATDNYLLELPPRVLLAGGHPGDFDNLGSQAMTNGMKRMIAERYPGSSYALLEYPWNDPWRSFPSYDYLARLPQGESLTRFLEEVDHLVQVGRILRDERESSKPSGVAGGLRMWLKLIVGLMRKAPYKPNFPSFKAVLNDPLAIGQGPTLAEIPEGSQKGADGWLQVTTSAFERLLRRQIPGLLVKRIPRLAMILFRYQFRKVQPDYLSRLSLLTWADLVYFDGNGLFSEAYSWSGTLLIRYLAECLVAKKLGAEVYLVNHTVSVTSPWLKEIISHVDNELDGVVIREPDTRKKLEDIGVKPELIFEAADAALWADYGGGKFLENDKLSALRKRYQGAVVLFIRGDLMEDTTLWAQLVEEISNKYKKPVIYIPSCKGDDVSFAKAIAKNSSLQVIEDLNTYDEVTFILQEMSLVISSRYHPIYFSIIAEIPFVAVRGNTFKTEGLLRLLEYPLAVIKEDEKYKERVLEQVDYIFSNYKQMKNHVIQQKPILKEKAKLNIGITDKVKEYSFWVKGFKSQ